MKSNSSQTTEVGNVVQVCFPTKYERASDGSLTITSGITGPNTSATGFWNFANIMGRTVAVKFVLNPEKREGARFNCTSSMSVTFTPTAGWPIKENAEQLMTRWYRTRYGPQKGIVFNGPGKFAVPWTPTNLIEFEFALEMAEQIPPPDGEQFKISTLIHEMETLLKKREGAPEERKKCVKPVIGRMRKLCCNLELLPTATEVRDALSYLTEAGVASAALRLAQGQIRVNFTVAKDDKAQEVLKEYKEYISKLTVFAAERRAEESAETKGPRKVRPSSTNFLARPEISLGVAAIALAGAGSVSNGITAQRLMMNPAILMTCALITKPKKQREELLNLFKNYLSRKQERVGASGADLMKSAMDALPAA